MLKHLMLSLEINYKQYKEYTKINFNKGKL